MFNFTFSAMPLFFRHQKDSGSWSIYKGENFFNENCILEVIVMYLQQQHHFTYLATPMVISIHVQP